MEQKIDSDQVSTKEFVLSVVDYFKFILGKWRIILIALLLGTCYDLVSKSLFVNTKEYSGQMTFHLELDGGGNQGGQLAGLAGAFGLGGAAPTQGSILAATNFESILTSLSVFQIAMMKEIKLPNGKKELFINYYCDSSDIKSKEWKGSLFRSPSGFLNYRMKSKKIEDFTPMENQMMSEVFLKLSSETRMEPRQASSLFELYATTTNELLTKDWMEILIATTEDFYREMKTKKTKLMLRMQQDRLDSLSYAMKNNDARLARATFDNPNVVDPNGGIKQQVYTRNNTYITNQYFTQLATVEGLNRTLFEQTPIFTILEPVRLPLIAYKKVGISTRINGLIYMVVAIALLSFYRIYKNAVA